MGGRGGRGGDRAAFRTQIRTKKKKKQPQTSRDAPVVCPCTHKRVFPKKHARIISTGKPSTDPAPRKWSRPAPAFLIASRHRPASRPHRRRPFCLPRGAPPEASVSGRIGSPRRTGSPPSSPPHPPPPSSTIPTPLPSSPAAKRARGRQGKLQSRGTEGGGGESTDGDPPPGQHTTMFRPPPPPLPAPAPALLAQPPSSASPPITPPPPTSALPLDRVLGPCRRGR